MLKKVREGEELDAGKLSLFLYQNGLMNNSHSEISVQQFSNGFSNLTYLLTVDEQEFVLRKPPLGAIKRGHDMGREYKVLSHLSKHFDKAPKTFVFEESGGIIGSPFYLMEKIEGVVINYREATKRALSSDDFKVISNTWLDAFVALHELDYKQVGLADLGRPAGYVKRQVTNWSKQYLKAATMDIPEASFVMDWMDAHQPKQYQHSLIHNDYKYDNVVFEEGDWTQINAILDWEMCTIGDPLMDLGTSLGYWTMASDGPAFAQALPTPTILSGNPSRTDVVQAYATKSGRSIDHLVFYYVFGLFKIAVIVQQIFYRYNKGLTQNKKFQKLDTVCAFLCQTAKRAIEKKRIDHLF